MQSGELFSIPVNFLYGHFFSIKQLEEEKILLSEKIQNCGRPLQGFDDTFRTAMMFLGNPRILWASERIEDKRTVLKLAFSEKLPHCRKEGFRTARTALPFRLLEGLEGGGKGMVRMDVNSSNHLFKTLEEWNSLLHGSSLDNSLSL
ncbi:MAG: hypothetical protein ACE5EK_00260 [Nitrospinales bacterium]